jgi:hypothetical protein
VFVHHYHNVLVQENDVIVSNDQNEMFKKALIDAYLLGVSNPKGCVHSQPHRHFYLKHSKKPLCFSFCHFFYSYFFILIGAMSESTLERLR